MTERFEPSGSENVFSPPNIIIPKTWEEARDVLEERFIKDSYATNAREIAQYVEKEIVTGQQWLDPDDPNKIRSTFRKLVSLQKTDGSGGMGLNDFTVANPQENAHGLQVDANFVVTKISGSASDGGTSYIPIPFVEAAGTGHIELAMDATNIVLTTPGGGVDYSAYNEAYVIIEFIRE